MINNNHNWESDQKSIISYCCINASSHTEHDYMGNDPFYLKNE